MIIIPTEKRFDWKHTPLVLFILVLINVMVFFAYQFGDTEKQFDAITDYQQHEFLVKEWPLYVDYLKQNQAYQRLEESKKLYENIQTEDDDAPQSEIQLIYTIISDPGFYQYLEQNAYNVFYLSYIEKWALPRSEINDTIQSVSSVAFGLIPNQLGLVTLLTHQFLHGGVMHLLGNMFFLIICGFAVEAAIGHLRFLLFYLASGVAGGLLFAVMDLSSVQPLVGASGAISGVMAMYLGVFRFKKIEFFYWLFVFVGYFRAPALLILPFYIGKELFSYFSDSGTNVAFMAHAGGFIAGSLMMAIAYYLNPKMMNEAYIEEDQETPQLQLD
ncbi:MAG TPA: rhomboid family intramembrane serine protease, partial [Oceanospirillales bacterium]|nr:rhomboid family intramembrane serine protease [Oceanospirillales bacterium]